MIEKVEVVNPAKVELHLSEPFSSLLNNLSVPVAGIISAKAIADAPKKLANTPAGSGPFVLKSWNPDERMVLERNEDYWGDKPGIKTLEILPIPEASTRFAAVQSGEVDIIENPPPSELEAIRGSNEIKEILEPKAQPVFLGFELKEVPDVKVRKAIAMAIDKKAIVDDVLEGIGEPADKGLLPPELITPADQPVNIPHDLAGAKKLMSEAGVGDVKLKLVSPAARYLKDNDVAAVIKAQLAKIGVTADLQIQESGTWFTSLLEHRTQMYVLGWGVTAGDPADLLTRVFTSGAVNNMAGYSGADKQIKQLATMQVKSEEREDLMNEIQRKIVMEDVVVVPIYHSKNFHAARSTVEGFGTTTANIWKLAQVSVTK